MEDQSTQDLSGAYNDMASRPLSNFGILIFWLGVLWTSVAVAVGSVVMVQTLVAWGRLAWRMLNS